MTQPETHHSLPESDRPRAGADTAEPGGAGAETGAEDAAPAPEPWTAERVTEWNAYYDIYVALGVLLLAFVASANKISHAAVWDQLQVGRLIAAQGAPVTRDPFSYTEPGRPWVNVSWLFDWSHAVLFRAGSGMAPADPADPVASAARAEQVGAGALVALGALVRVFTALLLLGIRRPGPGRWWSAVCTALALGAVVSPAGWTLGGIAGPGIVAPQTWGALFLAAELWLLFRGDGLGRRAALPALVALFVLWANVDESFFVGLLVLAASVAGNALRARGAASGVSPRVGLAALAGCALACVANPAGPRVFAAGVDPFLSLFRPSTDVTTIEQLSFFGATLRNRVGDEAVWLQAYYLLLVALGLAGFALNRRRFNPSRLLVFAVAAILWGAMVRYAAEFAVVWAATLALNGQEWYLDRFGASGRLGWNWSLWSVGGRAVTIVLLFLCVARALTGYGAAYGESRFGFGFDPDDFAFEAADFLKGAAIKGNILNTTLAQGDALVWRAYPERKVYIDSRRHLYPPEVLNELTHARKALSTDDVEGWRPLLDKYNVSAVMIEPLTAPNTYQALSRSAGWVPFYDDGQVVLFGRMDAARDDVAFFTANRLEPESTAYRRTRPTPAADRPPTPVSWMDTIFQRRSTERSQPHTEAARRWLAGAEPDGSGVAVPDPARSLLAVREARTALASKPDDTQAFRLLAAAYRALTADEAALMMGLKLGPETAAQVSQIEPRPDLLMTRFRERVTALNYAIQTTPPPREPHARHELLAVNLELYRLYLGAGWADLARDRLQAVLDLNRPGDYTPEQKSQLSQDLARLNEQVNRVQNGLSELAVDQQSNPVSLASFALSQGAPGLAIHELEEADRTGVNPAMVKPQLVDLYCDTGQPEKAVELFGSNQVNDPAFGREPGAAALRQARAYFLLGNAEHGAYLLEKFAIPALRYSRGNTALAAAAELARGQAKEAASAFMDLPQRVGQQALWEFEAGLYRLEAGTPDLAAEHFTNALTLSPDFSYRPIAAYYLEHLGKPVPPPGKPADDAKKVGSTGDDAGAKSRDEGGKTGEAAPRSADETKEKVEPKKGRDEQPEAGGEKEKGGEGSKK